MKIWITSNVAINLLGISKQAFHKARREGKYQYRDGRKNGGDCFEILLATLPIEIQKRYFDSLASIATSQPRPLSDAELYAEAPEYNRRKADKYLAHINRSEGLGLREYCASWSAAHPDDPVSHASLYAAIRAYRKNGIAALLGKWGKVSRSSVDNDLFSFFKSNYLQQGKPSAVTCWKLTLGFAAEHGVDTDKVPSHSAFMRRLEKEVPEQAIYAARNGESAANRRYGFYIKRDMSDVVAGEVWVFDHAQIDIGVFYKDRNGREKVGFPWVTAARDYKSGKWVGWDLYIGGPSSDNVFMAFYRAAVKWGVPSWLYLDNGKDFRSKRFSGGRDNVRLDVPETKAIAMTAALGIKTVFAWPYNAQAKVVERDFNRNKEWFSRLSDGFRGGNVVERPENLNDKIAGRKIITFEEMAPLWTKFIEEVVMQSSVSSGYREGKCPNELWAEEYPEALKRGLVRIHTKDALKLFCAKTSSIRKIDRRGFFDAELGIWYYDAWMEGQKGRKVYLRRDPLAMQDAFVFDASTHEPVGQAYYLPDAPGLARGDVQLADLKEQISIKRTAEKVIRTLSKPDEDIPFDYKIALMANATRVLNDRRGYNDRVPDSSAAPIHVTDMDKAITQQRRMAAEGTVDLAYLRESFDKNNEPKRNLIVFESEREQIAATA